MEHAIALLKEVTNLYAYSMLDKSLHLSTLCRSNALRKRENVSVPRRLGTL